eukprot:GILJ01007605.1.p1 GENE.GILJ01007605.1~~GILJ01007605.1.p1  ORF type:complete len:304 (-),score=71.47 GILJ01007605.1:336-1247(-)
MEEVEEQVILRVPSEMAERLRAMIRDNEFKQLEITPTTSNDLRHFKFKLDKVSHDASLVELPCIIESQKTLDKKTFFKVADISQMLVVHGPDGSLPKKQLGPNYEWKSGITPGTKYIRRRRFRKRGIWPAADIRAVETDILRVMQGGAASNIEEELVEEEAEDSASSANDGNKKDKKKKRREKREKKKERRKKKGEQDTSQQDETNSMAASVKDEEEEQDAAGNGDDEEEEEIDINVLRGKMQTIQDDIDGLEEMITNKQEMLQESNNPVLQERFSQQIENLMQEKAEKEQELREVQNQLVNR